MAEHVLCVYLRNHCGHILGTFLDRLFAETWYRFWDLFLVPENGTSYMKMKGVPKTGTKNEPQKRNHFLRFFRADFVLSGAKGCTQKIQ